MGKNDCRNAAVLQATPFHAAVETVGKSTPCSDSYRGKGRATGHVAQRENMFDIAYLEIIDGNDTAGIRLDAGRIELQSGHVG